MKFKIDEKVLFTHEGDRYYGFIEEETNGYYKINVNENIDEEVYIFSYMQLEIHESLIERVEVE